MPNPSSWQALGSRDPRDLTDARLQLHWAVQIAAALANALLPKRPDDGQDNFGWEEEHGALVGRPVPGGLRAGLDLPGRRLILLRGDAGPEPVIGTVDLPGRKLEQARLRFEEMARKLLPLSGSLAPDSLALRDYSMPDHPVRSGAPFDLDPEASAEVGRWFSLAAAAQQRWAAQQPRDLEIRCWPHHFDLGLFFLLDEDEDPETARSIGIGLSPGDGTIPEPYFYVSPYNRPKDRQADPPPPLPGPGHWHHQGFFAAVLTGTELLAAGSDPLATADRFLAQAVAAARQ